MPWDYAFDQGKYVEFTSTNKTTSVLMQIFSCVLGSPHPDRVLSSWTFYLVVMIFDALTLSIATYYLLKAQKAVGSA
jgi:magnesium-transporting ATPase (P-type)